MKTRCWQVVLTVEDVPGEDAEGRPMPFIPGRDLPALLANGFNGFDGLAIVGAKVKLVGSSRSQPRKSSIGSDHDRSANSRSRRLCSRF